MFLYSIKVASDLSLGTCLFLSSPLCLSVSLHVSAGSPPTVLLLLCFPSECDCVWVSVFVWCLSIRTECLNSCLCLSCCVFLCVSTVGLCVFLSKSVCMHTHTQARACEHMLGSPNMLNGPLRRLYVGLGVDGEGEQREAAGFCKNIKSQIK